MPPSPPPTLPRFWSEPRTSWNSERNPGPGPSFRPQDYFQEIRHSSWAIIPSRFPDPSRASSRTWPTHPRPVRSSTARRQVPSRAASPRRFPVIPSRRLLAGNRRPYRRRSRTARYRVARPVRSAPSRLVRNPPRAILVTSPPDFPASPTSADLPSLRTRLPTPPRSPFPEIGTIPLPPDSALSPAIPTILGTGRPAGLRVSFPPPIPIPDRRTRYRRTEPSFTALLRPPPPPRLSERRLPTDRFPRRSRIRARTESFRGRLRPERAFANPTILGMSAGHRHPVPPIRRRSRARRSPRPEPFGIPFRTIPRRGTVPLGPQRVRPRFTTLPQVRPPVITLALRVTDGTVPSVSRTVPRLLRR